MPERETAPDSVPASDAVPGTAAGSVPGGAAEPPHPGPMPSGTVRPAPVQPEPVPQWDQVHGGKQWGQTPEPTQEPAATPSGAKTWTLGVLGLIVLIAIVLIVVAVATS